MADSKPRGLVIAIEKYPNATDVADELTGTKEVGLGFRKWLIEHKSVDPADIGFCTEGGVEGRTAGTTKSEILDEVERLLETGQDRTEQLFVLFVGHGVDYEEDVSRQSLDMLLTAEYRDAGHSGDACIKVGEFAEALWHAFGPGEHFYFIDCCRSAVDRNDFNPSGLGRRFSVSKRAKPSRGLLFAVGPGMAATTNSRFEKALSDGLVGNGIAKTWEEPEMWVTWTSLVKYISTRADGVEPVTRGDSDRLLLQIDPIPQYTCSIRVRAAAAEEPHVLRLLNGKGDLLKEYKFKGSSFEFSRHPDTLRFELTDSQGHLQRITFPELRLVDLYEDLELEFARQGPHPPDAARGPTLGRASIWAPDTNLAISIRDLSSGEETQSFGGALEVNPGNYEIEMRDDSGSSIRRSELHVPVGVELHLDRWAAPASPVRESLADHFPNNDYGIDFSESLGWTQTADTQVWLAIVGAARIIGPSQFSKLGPLPLMSFEDLASGASAIYVLAGVGVTDPPSVGLTGPDGTDWVQAASPIEHVNEVRIPAGPGPQLVSLRLPGRLPITVASHCLPNRVTLIVVTDEGDARPQLSQYLLPPGHLVTELPDKVRERLGRRGLQVVRFISLSQSLFRAGHRLEPPGDAPGDRDPGQWDDLLYGKWLDPLMGIMASYQMLREGQAVPDVVFENLAKFFGEIADVQALMKLTGRSDAPVQNVPLIRDGLLALDDDSALPFPSGKLAYHDFWTMWVGATE